MKITSLNIGRRETLQVGDKIVETGIYKNISVDMMKVNHLGVVNDFIADTKRHGGMDQAVYLYSLGDYAFWEEELQRDMPPGTFGENLTISSFSATPLRIGDRFQINNVTLEVTFGRIPCDKLGARMGAPNFVKKFTQAQRPGIYTRVINQGELRVGDAVHHIPTTADYPTVIELYNLWYLKERSPELLRKGLASPIAERARLAFQFWLYGEK